MRYKIGIIVPIYKVEKFIAECIESILEQTYTNFRLILVDDGTPDNAGKICDEYAKKDPRITVIHQENAGVTRARARGFEEAKDCEFLTFVDGDDTLTPNALNALTNIITPDCNIAIGNIYRYNEKICRKSDRSIDKVKVYRINHEKHRENMFLGIDAGLWGKLIHRNILTSEIFNIPQRINMGEDVITNVKMAFNNKKDVYVTTEYVYRYRQHNTSIMHTFKRNDKYDEMYFEFLWENIPDDYREKYSKLLIRRKIMTFDYHFGYSIETPEWIGTDFHKNLLKDIQQNKFRSLPIERLLLTTTHKNLRAILILIKRIKNKLIKFFS